MNITEIGRNDVLAELKLAIEDLDKKRKAVTEAMQRVERLNKVNNCDHPSECLEVKGGFILVEIYCSKCGYTWMD